MLVLPVDPQRLDDELDARRAEQLLGVRVLPSHLRLTNRVDIRCTLAAPLQPSSEYKSGNISGIKIPNRDQENKSTEQNQNKIQKNLESVSGRALWDENREYESGI